MPLKKKSAAGQRMNVKSRDAPIPVFNRTSTCILDQVLKECFLEYSTPVLALIPNTGIAVVALAHILSASRLLVQHGGSS